MTENPVAEWECGRVFVWWGCTAVLLRALPWPTQGHGHP